MILRRGKDKIVVTSINTPHYVISEVDGKFDVQWQKSIEEAIKLPRYTSWFSCIDLVRTNFQTILNARFNKESDAAMISECAYQCIIDDVMCNQIVQQCFRELRII